MQTMRKYYNPAFKEQAYLRVLNDGMAPVSPAQGIGAHENALRRCLSASIFALAVDKPPLRAI